MYHKTTLVGHAGRDPEMKYLNDGKAVTKFSLAVSDGFGDKKKTIWFSVTVWGKLAETANQYVVKGSKLLVEGKLASDDSGNPRTYTAKNGEVKASFEITATELTFLSSKGESEQQQQESQPKQTYTKPAQSEMDEEDIPF